MLDEHGRAVTAVGKTAGRRDRIDHIETTPVLEFARMSEPLPSQRMVEDLLCRR